MKEHQTFLYESNRIFDEFFCVIFCYSLRVRIEFCFQGNPKYFTAKFKAYRADICSSKSSFTQNTSNYCKR